MKNKYAIVLVLTLLMFSSCSKSSDNNDNTTNEVFEAQFSGNMTTGNINNDVDGIVSISETGNFMLESFIGRLTGNAELENNIYTITNISGNGVFESSTFSEGQLNLNNLNLNIEGTYVDSAPIAINGEVEIIWIGEYEQMWTDARTKSSVFFTHNELCLASITIDGVTLEGLDSHYTDGGLCNQSVYGNLFTTKYHKDVDNDTSEIFCNTQTLFNPNTGEYVTSNWCQVSKFIVDKNTEYTYTVNWDNGYSYTDTFTSADGGQGVTICLTNPLDDCDGSSGGGSINIFENTIFIDYSISNSPETEQFNFQDFCYLDEYGQMEFGSEIGYLALHINDWNPVLNEYPVLHTGSYIVGENEDELNIDCFTNGGWNHFGVSGTVDITYLENEPTSGGEIHATFNNVRVKRYTNDEYFIFSGTLKGRWNN